MAKPTILNITPAGRSVESEFVELPVKANIGPVLVLPPNTSLETNVIPKSLPVTVATWNVMDKFDTGLKLAIIDFIDTTKEGVKAPHTLKGRTKIIEFNFYGTGTKSVVPDEIGEFTISLSYPPGANTSSSSVSANIQNISTL